MPYASYFQTSICITEIIVEMEGKLKLKSRNHSQSGLPCTGPLSPPENVQINESVISSTIEWNPPYSSLNSNTVHVNSHIIQYTVYITDVYTGNTIVKENVTETQYTFNVSNDGSCPMYQISAWNAGGESNRSETLQGYSPHSKLSK